MIIKNIIKIFLQKNLFIYSLFFAQSCFLLSQETTDQDFIVKQEDSKIKKLSKTEIKEDIGQNIKDALHLCVELNKQIGKIQIDLAQLQKNLFTKVEELIDDKRPFKKASRQDLTEALNVIKSVTLQVSNQVESVKKLEEQINKSKCLKG